MAQGAKAVLSTVAEPEPAAKRSFLLRQFLTVALLAVVSIAGGFILVDKAYLWDEAVYLASGDNFSTSQPYYSELEFRPPLLPALLAVGARVLPMDLWARLLALAFFAGTVLLVYFFGLRLYGYLEAVGAAASLALSPFLIHQAAKVMADIPATAAVCASTYLLFRHVDDEHDDRSILYPLGAGLLLACATLFRWIAGAAVIYALFLLVSRQLKIRSAAFYAAGFSLGMAPYLVFARIRYHSFFKPLWTAFTIIEEGSEPVPDRLYYLSGIVKAAGGVALAGLAAYFLVLVVRRRRGWMRRELPLLVWFVAFAVLVTALSHKEVRYILPAMPVLFLFAGRGFALLRDDWGICLLGLLVPFGAALSVIYPNYFQGRERWEDVMIQYSAETRAAGEYMRSALPPGARVYSNHLWPVVAYYSKRPTVALWPRDERFYRAFPGNMKQDGYFVYCRGVEKEPSQQWLDGRAEFQKLREFQDVILYSYKYAGQAALGPEFDKLLQQARSEFNEGRYDVAIETLSAITIPDIDVCDLRGWSYYRIGKIEEAADAFNEGLRAEPGNPRCLTGLGFAELRQGDASAALPHFEMAVRQLPDKVDALTGYGLALLRSDRKREAADAFRRVLAQTPDNTDVQEYLKQAQAP